VFSHAGGDDTVLSETGLQSLCIPCGRHLLQPRRRTWQRPVCRIRSTSLSERLQPPLVTLPTILQSQPPNSRFLRCRFHQGPSVTGAPSLHNSSDPTASCVIGHFVRPGRCTGQTSIDGLDMPKICHRSVLATDEMLIAVGLDNAGAVELLNASKEDPSPADSRLSLCHQPRC
jgi:hypothetical protein